MKSLFFILLLLALAKTSSAQLTIHVADDVDFATSVTVVYTNAVGQSQLVGGVELWNGHYAKEQWHYYDGIGGTYYLLSDKLEAFTNFWVGELAYFPQTIFETNAVQYVAYNVIFGSNAAGTKETDYPLEFTTSPQAIELWFDWDAFGNARLTYGTTSPNEFNRYLSDGSINPNYVAPLATKKHHGKK